MKKLKAHWEVAVVSISCSWCFADMMTLTLEEVKHIDKRNISCGVCNGINYLPNDLLYKAQFKQPIIDPLDPPGRAMAFDNIVGNIVLKRAIEIAITGNHTLTYVGDPDIAWNNVVAILGPKATQITKCKCGGYQDPVKECTCTWEEIEKWRESRAFEEALASDIHIEVVTPRPDEMFSWREPYSDVLKRIRNVRENQVFQKAGFQIVGDAYSWDKREYNREVMTFLSGLRTRLNLTQTQLASMCRVALTIADMDGKQFVSHVHIAEAAGYKTPLLLGY